MLNIRDKEKIVMLNSMVKPELTSEKSPEPRTMSDFYKASFVVICLFVFLHQIGRSHASLQGTKPEKSTNGSPSARTLEILIHMVKPMTVCCRILGRSAEAM